MAKNTAFSDKISSRINNTINTLRDRHSAHLRHGLSTRFLFDTLVREKDKAPLQHVQKIVDFDMLSQRIEVTISHAVDVEPWGKFDISGKLNVIIYPHTADYKFMAPKYLNKARLTDFPEKFTQYAVDRCLVGLEWAIVRRVFNSLNQICSSPIVMKTVFPSIIALLKANKETYDRAVKLAASKDSMDVPALPFELRSEAIRVATTITKGLILPEKPDDKLPADKFGVEISGILTTLKDWGGIAYTAN